MLSARLAAKDDLLSQVLWRGVRARVLARRGEIRRGRVAGARGRGASRKQPTSLTTARTRCSTYRWYSKPRTGGDEAIAALSAALRLYELKGNHVSASATRLWLGGLA